MGSNGVSENFEIHNFFKNPPSPGYNQPPAPYLPPGHSYHNFPPNNFPLSSSYGPSTSSYSNLAASYPFGSQGAIYNQYPPYTQDQLPGGPPYSAPGYGQPNYATSMPLPLPLSGSHQNASQTNATSSSSALDSARLMALLTNSPPGVVPATTSLELQRKDSLNPNTRVELSHPPAAFAPAIPSAPPVSLAPTNASGRCGRSRIPRGRYLKEEHVAYDVDVRLAGEAQPQLEHNTITKYVSDPQVLIGRQIAVNRTYICYALRATKGIRVLNINTALRYLLQGHSEGRVTDMAFFGEDVHLLASASSDGRVFVRRIVEGLGEDDKVQISDEVLLAIHFLGDWDSVHPRVCWQAHTEDRIFVGISKYVVAIDMKKLRRRATPDVKEPVLCSLESPIEGVACVGVHDDDVTDLSSSPSIQLVSASKDGMVRIWRDQNMLPPLTIKPYDGLPVDGVALLSSAGRSDFTVLLTAGPLNRELKLWVPAVEEGWYSLSASLSWKCVQTLELKSSSGEKPEVTFFNQLLVLPTTGIILLPNARRNALYVVHMSYGPNPAITRMDYLAEFSVMMPILSITARSEHIFDGEDVVQVYCVQTEAIQQYALDLSLCTPPSEHTTFGVVDKELKGSLGSNIMNVEASSTALEVSAMLRAKSPGPISGVSLTDNVLASCPTPVISIEQSSITDAGMGAGQNEVKEVSAKVMSTSMSHIVAPTPQVGAVSLSPRGSTLARTVLRSSTMQNSPREQLNFLRSLEQMVENKTESDVNEQDTISLSPRRASNDVVRITEDRDWQVISTSPGSSLMPEQGSTAMHLVTPSELMCMVARSKGEVIGGSTISSAGGVSKDSTKQASRLQDFVEKEDLEVLTVETKEVTDSTILFPGSTGIEKEGKDLVAPGFMDRDQVSAASDYLHMDIAKEERDIVEELGFEQASADPDQSIADEVEDCLPTIPAVDEQLKEVSVKVDESSAVQVASQSRKKKNKNKADASTPITLPPPSAQRASPSSAPLPSVPDQDLGNGASSNLQSSSAVIAQFFAMQESVNQLLSMQREFQKQIGTILAMPIAKEVKKMEVTLGQRMEKLLKMHSDALWSRLQEENMKREKLEKDRMQQLTSTISAFFSKDMPAAVERALKKELSSLGAHVTRLVIPSIEKAVTASLNESFQKAFGEKGVAQLEKSVGAKVEALVSRQLQMQFQTSGKQALQEGLRSCLEASLIPAFEQACHEMFGQVDATFQKGLLEHRAQAQQQSITSHSALVTSLQEAIASASSLAAFMKGDLADGQRKILALIENAGGARMTKTVSGSLPEKAMTVEWVEESLDPTKELSRLISERKLEEAFTRALSLSNVGVVSWLCNQVDFAALFTMSPIPLSQGVLLALVQQLGCDLGNDTGKKLMWIKDAALHLNPHDPVLAPHMRQFLEKLYNHLLALAETSLSPELANSTRLVIHVVHSLLSVYANEAKYTHY